MTGFNLPPGCRVSDIPGNSDEDAAWEEFNEWAMDKFCDSKLSVEECKKAVLAGIEKTETAQVDLRAVRQSGNLKLAEIMQNPENIPVVIEYINELREVADIAHDLILDWRTFKRLRASANPQIADFINQLDEALVSIGYLDEQED